MKDVWRRGKRGKPDDKHFQKENECGGIKKKRTKGGMYERGTAQRKECTEDEEKKIEFEDDIQSRKGKERFSWTDCFWKWDSDAEIRSDRDVNPV
jgi:hypothetical protein